MSYTNLVTADSDVHDLAARMASIEQMGDRRHHLEIQLAYDYDHAVPEKLTVDEVFRVSPKAKKAYMELGGGRFMDRTLMHGVDSMTMLGIVVLLTSAFTPILLSMNLDRDQTIVGFILTALVVVSLFPLWSVLLTEPWARFRNRHLRRSWAMKDAIHWSEWINATRDEQIKMMSEVEALGGKIDEEVKMLNRDLKVSGFKARVEMFDSRLEVISGGRKKVKMNTRHTEMAQTVLAS